jgi:hypothetical protein
MSQTSPVPGLVIEKMTFTSQLPGTGALTRMFSML